MNSSEALFKYILRLGDNALIHGHRLSEWCSKGPTLEEDLALANIALDNIGRAQSFLKYAAEIEGKGNNEDTLAYRRSERMFYNNLIVELPNGDFAFTIAKMLLISAFEKELFFALGKCADTTIAGISLKALKESKYHFTHSRDWCIRLGKGTDVSKNKIQNALNELWMYTGELFEMDDIDKSLLANNTAVNFNDIKANWNTNIENIIQQAGLSIPKTEYMQTGGKKGIHTEHLGFILAEMQYLQRAYPDATW